ncbi:MAG: tetratricopeptide repeat protein, partial [Myxococcales bacterium]
GNVTEADALVERATQERPDDPQVYLVLASYRSRNGDRAGGLEAAEKAVSLDPARTESQLRKAEILVEMGFRKEKENGIEDATAIVADVLAKHPSNPDALFVDAKIKVTREQLAEAISSVRAALEARPDWAEARYVLGAALAAHKEYAASRSELGRALELDPSMAEASQVLAQVHHRLGEYEYAVDMARRFQRMRPNDLKMSLLVAQSLVNLGKLAEAQAELDLVPAENRNAEVQYALGRISVGRGEIEIARAYFVEAAAGMPNQPEVLENLIDLDSREVLAAQQAKSSVRLETARQRRAESIDLVQQAVAAKPNDAKLQQLDGVVAVVEDRMGDAEKAFLKAIELDPTDRSSYDRLARFYNATGKMPQAIEVYVRGVEALPEDPQFHHTLGMLYELRDEAGRAVPHYEEAIRLSPGLAEAKNNLAYIYVDQGQNLDRALDLAQDAKTLLPNNPSVSDTLGWVLYKRGVPAAAISYLKEAEAATTAGDGSQGVVRHHLAMAYEANGDTEEAIAALDRALSAVDEHNAATPGQGGKPGTEPAWVGEARRQREKLVAQRGSS